jgi:hypothetical protein
MIEAPYIFWNTHIRLLKYKKNHSKCPFIHRKFLLQNAATKELFDSTQLLTYVTFFYWDCENLTLT